MYVTFRRHSTFIFFGIYNTKLYLLLRQQRLEIVRKQEKLEKMLGGPRGAGARGRGGRDPGGGVRPESPPVKPKTRPVRRIAAAPKEVEVRALFFWFRFLPNSLLKMKRLHYVHCV